MVFLSRSRRPSIKALGSTCRAFSQSLLPSPSLVAERSRDFPPSPPTTHYASPWPNHARPPTSLAPGLKRWNLGYVVTMEYKGLQEPLIRTSSPAPLAQDFARQQVSKQQRSNYHSSSISSQVTRTMVSHSVNKTGLHPAGVQ
jgi:hypothetical protein